MRPSVRNTILLLNLLILFGLAADVYAGNDFPLLSPDPVERREAARAGIILVAVIAIVIIAKGYKQNPKIVGVVIPAGIVAFVIESLGRWGWGFIRFCIAALAVLIIVALFLSIFFLVKKIRGQRLLSGGYFSRVKGYTSPNSNPWPFSNVFGQGSGTQNVYGVFTTVLYHGTPQIDNARDIVNGRGTFLVGPGNANGTGLYLADLQTATSYAGNTGAILKIKLQIPWSQIADYNEIFSSPRFLSWSTINGNGNMGDNITNYSINVLKKRYLKVNQNLYVALAQKTQMNERVVLPGLTVLEVLDSYGNQLYL